MANTTTITDKIERKKVKRAARKKAAPKAPRTGARGENKQKLKKALQAGRNRAPQGLKSHFFARLSGTAEAVPFRFLPYRINAAGSLWHSSYNRHNPLH
jgi:hypothetical protein